MIKQTIVIAIEVNIERINTDRDALLKDILEYANIAHAKNLTFIIYTRRTEKVFADQQTRLQFGEQVSEFLMDTVRQQSETLDFLISEGGITSNDVLSSGLELRTSRVVGQIFPGC